MTVATIITHPVIMSTMHFWLKTMFSYFANRQVHIGSDPMSQADREDVLAERADATSEYHVRQSQEILSLINSHITSDSCS